VRAGTIGDGTSIAGGWVLPSPTPAAISCSSWSASTCEDDLPNSKLMHSGPLTRIYLSCCVFVKTSALDRVGNFSFVTKGSFRGKSHPLLLALWLAHTFRRPAHRHG
jgi:hypothetical protein